MTAAMAVISAFPMPRFSSTALAGARLRASPRYRIVAPDGLVPVDTGATRVAATRGHLVTPETAQLIASLRTPQRMRIRSGNLKPVARLILDGLIEIEAGGRFRSGPPVHHLFFPGDDLPTPAGTIGRLSFDALVHAATLGSVGPVRLSDRLYRYNSRPISPAWRRRVPDERALDRLLDVERPPVRGGSRRAANISSSYLQGTWRSWDVGRARVPSRDAPRYKLYVSPEPAETGAACRALCALLGTPHGPFTMKVGRELASLLRPDRLVAYFASRDDLFETAARLRQSIDGMPAQGVPFTAALGADGLLSWGADLPVSSPLPAAAHDRSWRGLVTSRLGSAIGFALATGFPSPVRFALDRASLDGVNTVTWAPAAQLLRFAGSLSGGTDADH